MSYTQVPLSPVAILVAPEAPAVASAPVDYQPPAGVDPVKPVADLSSPAPAPAMVTAAPAATGAPSKALAHILLALGVQVGMLMIRAGKTPDEVAADVGLSLDLVLQVMTGREPDISVRSLDAVATYLDGQLGVQLAIKPTLSQPASPPPAS